MSLPKLLRHSERGTGTMSCSVSLQQAPCAMLLSEHHTRETMALKRFCVEPVKE